LLQGVLDLLWHAFAGHTTLSAGQYSAARTISSLPRHSAIICLVVIHHSVAALRADVTSVRVYHHARAELLFSEELPNASGNHASLN
jgi:hypothetical protein